MSLFPGERVTLDQLSDGTGSPLLYWKNSHGNHTVYFRELRSFMDFDITDGDLYGWVTPKKFGMARQGFRKYLASSREPAFKNDHYFFLYQYCMRSCPYCAAKLGVTMTSNHKREGKPMPPAIDPTARIGVTISGGEIFMSEMYQMEVIAWLEKYKVSSIVALTSATYKTLKDKPLYNYFLERGRAKGDRHIHINMYVTINGHENVPLAHPAWGTPGYASSLSCVKEMYEDKDAFQHILVQVIANKNTSKALLDLEFAEKTVYTLNIGKAYGAEGREHEYAQQSVDGHTDFHKWYRDNYFNINDPLMTTAGKPDALEHMMQGLSAVDTRSYHIEWPRETRWSVLGNFTCDKCSARSAESLCLPAIGAGKCTTLPKLECATCPVFDACVFSHGRTHVMDYAAMECDQQRRDMTATLSIRYKNMTADEIMTSLSGASRAR